MVFLEAGRVERAEVLELLLRVSAQRITPRAKTLIAGIEEV